MKQIQCSTSKVVFKYTIEEVLLLLFSCSVGFFSLSVFFITFSGLFSFHPDPAANYSFSAPDVVPVLGRAVQSSTMLAINSSSIGPGIQKVGANFELHFVYVENCKQQRRRRVEITF